MAEPGRAARVPRFLSAVETTAAVFLPLIALLTAGNVLLRDLLSVQIPDWLVAGP